MTLRIKKSPGKRKRSGGGRPPDATREAHKGAVLDAAMAVFLERGFSRASMLDIARRAGASKGTLYTLYPSKAELFAALIRRRSLAVLESVTANAPNDKKSVPEALHAYGMRVIRSTQSPPSQRLYRLLVSEADKFPELAAAFWNNGPGLGRQVLRDYFSAMTQQRELSIENVDLATEQFLGALLGVLAVRSGLRIPSPIVDDDTLERWVSSAVSAFLRAYAVKNDNA